MTHTTESMVTQAELADRLEAIWRNKPSAMPTMIREKERELIISALRHRTAAQPEREAVLAGVVAAKRKMQHCRDELNVAIETLVDAHVALTTPTPDEMEPLGAEFAAVWDANTDKLYESEPVAPAERPSTRTAVMGEVAPAVSRDEIDAVFSENLPEQAARLGVHYISVESPGRWRDRVRKAAILSRIWGEGE